MVPPESLSQGFNIRCFNYLWFDNCSKKAISIIVSLDFFTILHRNQGVILGGLVVFKVYTTNDFCFCSINLSWLQIVVNSRAVRTIHECLLVVTIYFITSLSFYHYLSLMYIKDWGAVVKFKSLKSFILRYFFVFPIFIAYPLFLFAK